MRFSSSSLLAGLALLSSVSAIWPAPTSQTNGTDVLWLDPTSVTTSYKPLGGHRRDAASASSDSKLINGAFDRFKKNVDKTAFVPWKFYPRGTSFAPAHNASGPQLKSITVEQTAAKQLDNHTEIDESYVLDVKGDGTAVIQAATAQGAMHGLTSLLQLFYKDAASNKIYTNLVPVHVEDKPAYTYRGLNMDISRNWEPPSSVKHLLDAMELAKFNVLHLHATDAQSWPIEITTIPELSGKGAYAPGLFWSVKDLDSVMSYATARGIEPIIEIDSPGHLSSVAYSYPELVAAFNVQPWSNDCAEPPCGSIQLNNPAVYEFFDKIYADLLPRTSKYSKRFHSGGDEVNANSYLLDPTVRSNDSAVLQPLLQKFKTHLQDLIQHAGLTPMVWEEMIVQWNLTLSPQTIVQTWQGQDAIAKCTSEGYRTLFGDYYHWYLDCGYGQWLDPNTTAIADGTSPIVPPYTDYCSPLKSWRQMYAYDPRANLSDAQIGYLYGGEVHIWHELTDAANLDSKVWPRALAPSEIMWSGIKGVKGVDEGVTRRMADLNERLVAWGFGSNPVTMTWCLQNKGNCTL